MTNVTEAHGLYNPRLMEVQRDALKGVFNAVLIPLLRKLATDQGREYRQAQFKAALTHEILSALEQYDIGCDQLQIDIVDTGTKNEKGYPLVYLKLSFKIAHFEFKRRVNTIKQELEKFGINLIRSNKDGSLSFISGALPEF